MNYTNKDIYLALKLIHDICDQNGGTCRKCPFYCKHTCMFNTKEEYPENWKLVPPPEPVEWRPFE